MHGAADGDKRDIYLGRWPLASRRISLHIIPGLEA